MSSSESSDDDIPFGLLFSLHTKKEAEGKSKRTRSSFDSPTPAKKMRKVRKIESSSSEEDDLALGAVDDDSESDAGSNSDDDSETDSDDVFISRLTKKDREKETTKPHCNGNKRQRPLNRLLERQKKLRAEIFKSSSEEESDEDEWEDESDFDEVEFSDEMYSNEGSSSSSRNRKPSNQKQSVHGKYKNLNKSSFLRMRKQISRDLFDEFNQQVFYSKLPKTHIRWNPKMRTTAGRCCEVRRRVVSIELSDKVLDNMVKLRSTLCHEMCHLAVMLLDGDWREGHGPLWTRWVRRASLAYSDFHITPRHSYEINFKYKWVCVYCYQVVGRHSQSIKTHEDLCGICNSKFMYLGEFDGSSNPVPTSAQNNLAYYVRKHFFKIRSKNRGDYQTHDEIMKTLAKDFFKRWGDELED